MDGSVFITIGGMVVTIIGVVLVFVKGRGENQNKATENRTAIDALIDARVSTELVRVYKRLDDQDTEIRILKDSDRTTKAIVRRWFHDLLSWDRTGRSGAMPLPSRDDMARLDLDPNEGTIPADQLAAMRAAATTEGESS